MVQSPLVLREVQHRTRRRRVPLLRVRGSDPCGDGATAARVIMTDLEELEESECWDLLAQETIGRLGLHFGALPRIVPMNFSLFERCIVVWSANGAAVTHALRDSVVAF